MLGFRPISTKAISTLGSVDSLLSASVQANCNVTSNINTNINLNSSVFCTSSCSNNLSTYCLLFGSANNICVIGTISLNSQIQLAGIASALSVSGANLATSIKCFTSIVCASTTNSNLSTNINLASIDLCVVSVNAALNTSINLASVVSCNSIVPNVNLSTSITLASIDLCDTTSNANLANIYIGKYNRILIKYNRNTILITRDIYQFSTWIKYNNNQFIIKYNNNQFLIKAE